MGRGRGAAVGISSLNFVSHRRDSQIESLVLEVAEPLLLFYGSILHLNSPEGEHCLGSSPEFCLSVNRTVLMNGAPRPLQPPSIEPILMFITNRSSLLIRVCQSVELILMAQPQVLCHTGVFCKGVPREASSEDLL